VPKKAEPKDPFTAEQRETILKMVDDFVGVLITESGENLRAAIDLVIEKLRKRSETRATACRGIVRKETLLS
jgi:hypothetical protein